MNPYQPSVLFGRNAIGAAGASFRLGSGDDLYRRSLYTYWKRQIPAANMRLLGADGRNSCRTRRERTNTPLQAFVTLNDPAFVETAQALGRRMHAEGGGDTRAGVRRGLWLVLQRPPGDEDVDDLVRLFEDALDMWEGREEWEPKAIDLATDPLGPLPNGLDAERAAAWTAVANVLLNLDAVLVKD